VYVCEVSDGANKGFFSNTKGIVAQESATVFCTVTALVKSVECWNRVAKYISFSVVQVYKLKVEPI
jgi:hypothetical protein